jgi:hypothetical protein
VYASERLVKLFWKELHPERPPIERMLAWDALGDWCEKVNDDALRRPYAHQWRMPRLTRALVIEPSPTTH